MVGEEASSGDRRSFCPTIEHKSAATCIEITQAFLAWVHYPEFPKSRGKDKTPKTGRHSGGMEFIRDHQPIDQTSVDDKTTRRNTSEANFEASYRNRLDISPKRIRGP